MTLAECRPGSRSSQFVGMLGQVATYVLKGDVLYLNLKMDSGDMVFSKLSSVTGRIVGPAGDTAPAWWHRGGYAGEQRRNPDRRLYSDRLSFPWSSRRPSNPRTSTPRPTYLLEVTIKDAQKNVVFRNSRPYQVLTQGNPTYHLEVELERVR